MTRKAKSKAWIREHLGDPYVLRAAAQGYRSRAAFKLLEIDDREKLLRPGQCVIDLGAAPGSWTQVIAARVRPGGTVIAVDILPLEAVAGATVVGGDFRERDILEKIDRIVGGRSVDLVVSDMAPNLSGVAASDQAQAVRLCELALDYAKSRLGRQGVFVVKVFQGAGYPEFLAAMRRAFASVVSRKPRASRQRSAEMYLVARGLRKG